jgi:ABC-2 type transport system ATP-binding protein
MSISVSHLTKVYGDQKAIDDLSFSIPGGGIVGFLGPNGAGKSTTMKILTGYLTPSAGTASVCGVSVADHPLQVKKKIGYLPESNPLYPEMYVKECLSFTASVYRIPHAAARISEMISVTGLTREWKKKIGTLSKGYRQRVGLAQALLHDPEVLILDEPTTGLDPNQLAEIRSLIRRLGNDKTVLLSTHILQEVEAICDRAIIISEGRIVADDTLAHLRQAGARGSITIEFSTAVDEALLRAIPGVDSPERLSAERWKLVSAVPEEVKKSLWQFTLQNNLNIVSLQSNAPLLEDVFRRLTTEGKTPVPGHQNAT